MKRLFKYTLPALIACPMMLAACSEWTEPESLGVYYPSPEEMNPELYAAYIQNLKNYKAGEHKMVIVSFDNIQGTPYKQAERLTVIPDSVDVVCLNNPDNLCDEYQAEMLEIHEKGTRIVYRIGYADFETDWKTMLEKNTELTEEQFLAYIGQRTDEMLALCDKYGYDGIMVDYSGQLYTSVKESELPVYNARQQAFLNRFTQWKGTHPNKMLMFYGDVQNLVPENMSILRECICILLKTAASTGATDINQKVKQAIEVGDEAAEEYYDGQSPVPTDRFIACTQLINEKNETHYWKTKDADGSLMLASKGTAFWVEQSSPEYVRKGIFVLDVQDEYHNREYRLLREIINIVNPNK